MQIVIDIPDNKYYTILNHAEEILDASSFIEPKYLYLAVLNGESLPKGHGRLIDADYLREDFKASKKISFAERMDISCIVDHAPTIIEADKGGEE